MPERKQDITETVADLDGAKVLVVKVDGAIRAVQTAEMIANRLDQVNGTLARLDITLAVGRAEHLADAQKRIDGQIATLTKRRAALTAEGVGAAVTARVQERRAGAIIQRDTLAAALVEMGGDPRPPTPRPTQPSPSPEPVAPPLSD
jgi:hypothetical protein